MRRLWICLSVLLTSSALATPLPLSLKDISLMLRSGYSSTDVLREIAQRHVLETLEPSAQQSFAQIGASRELIAVLERGSLQVDEATAAAARSAEATAAASREAQAEQSFRDATQVLLAQRARDRAAPPSGLSIFAALQNRLVVWADGTITPASSNALEHKKLVAFYFSAHWSAPCRKFTPELVDYYDRVSAQHPEFQLIFVSLDRSRYSWETYVRESRMPWLALDYEQLDRFAELTKLGGETLPSLLVIDDTGRIVASSYAGAKYLGPQNALAALDRLLAGPGAAPVASGP